MIDAKDAMLAPPAPERQARFKGQEPEEEEREKEEMIEPQIFTRPPRFGK